MALKLLEPAVRSRLRSGVAVTSVSQCVGELVENSIDAGGTCVAVRVDIAKFKVQVVDNGKGISLEDLNLIGGRYMTSKCNTIEDINSKLNFFGYRGEAIASIVDVSGTVEISSRHRLSQQTYSKIFHNGKAMPVTASKTHRPSVGTTITVYDFFYNMPVRRKGISPTLELEQVKKAVESIALVNSSISFSVRNDSTGENVLQTHKTNSLVSRFGLLFGRDKTTAMKDVFLSQAGFELSGFMSTDGHHNKSLQFIYVNGRIVKKTPLHTCVNNVLTNSLICRKLSKVADSNWRKKDQELGSDFVSPRHTPDVYGMYVLQIKCPRSVYDICLEPAKTLIEFKDWDGIIFAIKTLVNCFLVRYNLNLGLISHEQQEERNSTSPITDCHKVVAQAVESSVARDLILEPVLQSKPVRRSHMLLASQSLPPAQMCRNSTEIVDENSSILQTKMPECSAEVSEVTEHDISELDTERYMYVEHSLQADLPICSTKCMTVPDYEPEINMSTPNGLSELRGEIQGKLLQTSVDFTDSRLLMGHNTNEMYKYSTFINCTEPESRQYEGDKKSTAVDVESQSFDRFQSSSSFIKPHSSLSKKPIFTAHCKLSPEVNMPLTYTRGTTDSVLRINHSNSAALVSTETDSIQEQSLAPNTSFRSPLQSSSISSRLSRLFKKHPRKSFITPDSSSLSERRIHVIDHHQPYDSHVLHHSTDLQYKQIGGSVTKVNLYPDSIHSKVSLDKHTDRLLPLDPLTSAVVESAYRCTNSGLGYSVQGIQSSLTSNSTLDSQTAITSSSMMSTLPYGQGRKSSLNSVEIDYTHFSSSERLMSPLKSNCASVLGTVSCQNQCYAYNHNDHVSTTGQSDNGTSNNKIETSSDSTVSCQTPNAAGTNQQEAEQVVEDDYNILNSCFSNEDRTNSEICSTGHISMVDMNHNTSTTYLSKPTIPVQAGSCESIWKAVVDPVTGGTLYMHSKSGNCVPSLAHDVSIGKEVDSVASSFNKGDESMLSTDCTSSLRVGDKSLASIDTGLASGVCAPYPFHRLEKCVPRRMSNFDSSSGCSTRNMLSMDNRNLSISSLLTSYKPQVPLPDTKWRCQSELREVSSISCNETDTGQSFTDILKSWKNPTFHGGEKDILRAKGGKQSHIKVHSVINQYKFSREMFSNVKVLGQVDKKFIACVLDSCGKGSPDLLVMIDQHAAHERVRLESLLEDLYDTSTASAVGDNVLPSQVKSSRLFPPLAIRLQPNEVSLAKLFRDRFRHNGLSLKFDADDQVLVTSLPSVFMEREASEIRRGRPTVAPTILKDMIIKQIELLQTTCGVASNIPEAILNVLSSQACHGAIKFGDSLTLTECESLIVSLSQCNLPFQCAHGRPSIVPILDLHILSQRYPRAETTSFPTLRNLGHKISEPRINS